MTAADWEPSAGLEALRLRARLYALVRGFFAERGVLEVETPVLSEAGNTEPNIESFTAHFSGHRDAGAPGRWLRTSPEYPLKRLLAAGIGDCYELGRVFRNGEAGGRHNPEFTMLEWYRVGWDHRRLAAETVELVQQALGLAGRRAQVLETTYRALFVQAAGVDPFAAGDAELRAPLQGVAIDGDGLSRDDWLDLLMTHRVQPTFPADRITVVHDWPASQCALAKVRDGDPPVAERFELYLGTFELANGYLEYLYTPEAQEVIAKNYYRPRNEEVAKRYADVLKNVETFEVDDLFGGAAAAQKKFFDNNALVDQILAEIGSGGR